MHTTQRDGVDWRRARPRASPRALFTMAALFGKTRVMSPPGGLGFSVIQSPFNS